MGDDWVQPMPVILLEDHHVLNKYIEYIYRVIYIYNSIYKIYMNIQFLIFLNQCLND